MAKFEISYDTIAKTACAKCDGKEVPNMHTISLRKSYSGNVKPNEPDKYELDMYQHEHDNEHDMHTQHHTMAAEKATAAAVDSPLLLGMKVVTSVTGDAIAAAKAKASVEKAATDIVKFFSQDE